MYRECDIVKDVQAEPFDPGGRGRPAYLCAQ